MSRALVAVAFLVCVASATRAAAQGRARACPSARVDTSGWVVTRVPDVGIEIRRPPDYEEKRWESRSDTTGVDFSLWRSAARTMDFHQVRGDLYTATPSPSAVPCLLHTRSAPLEFSIERSKAMLAGGRDTTYYRGKSTFTPPGRPRMIVETGAIDSTELLVQLTMLRTMTWWTRR